MDKLIKARLFGAGLVAVRTPEMVSRYNQCLVELGIKPTELTEFSVDGMGWSPEIAKEKNDNFYLSHGDINHLVIIVSLDQRYKPIYFPLNSYDRRLINAYFDTFIKQITDITSNVALGLDIDAEITSYDGPADLLSVDYVIVRTVADDLSRAAQDQKAIVDEFNSADLGWFDPAVRQGIINSANLHGDLRYRQLEISDWKFDNIDFFHTQAFGGVFVLRNLLDGRKILILETPSDKKLRLKGVDVLTFTDKELLPRLESEGLVDTTLDWYLEHPEILEEKRGCLIADVICTNLPDVNYIELNSAQKKGYLRDLKNQLPKVFSELEKLMMQLNRDEAPEYESLSRDLRLLLLRPNHDLTVEQEEVIGRVIARLQPLSLLSVFTYDKRLFYERYSTWSESKKDWAIAEITRHYRPLMHQLSEK